MLTQFRITPVLCAACGAAAGFYFLSLFNQTAIFAVLFAALAAVCFFRALASLSPHQRNLRVTAVCAAVAAAGLVFGVCAADAGRNIVKFGIQEEKIIAVEGVLLEDPRVVSSGNIMASVSLRKSAAAGGVRTSASGEITVFFPKESAARLKSFGRGTVVFTEGRLRNAGTGFTFSSSSMHIVKPAPPIEQMRTGIRLKLIERFDNSAWGGLALALLLGIKDNLDSNLSFLYRGAGLSYVLALSGMHLAVIAALISFLLKKPLGLKPALIIGAVIISLYCLLVGPMPSLNRAAIMYLLGVLAAIKFLPKDSMSILALSFLIQIFVSPASGNTISFILSYLAMVGILITGKSLASFFTGAVPDFLLQPLAVSCGAFLATAGACYYMFGAVSPMGIIAGLVIVPATTAFMIGSMLWLVLDMVSLSWLLNLPLGWLYVFLEKTAAITGKVPAFTSAKPHEVLVFSIILSFFILILEHKRRQALVRLKPFSW